MPNAPAGHFDGLVSDTLCGWLWSGTRDRQRLTVAFFDGDKHIGEMVADTFREDLLRAGIGDGYHAFRWRVPENLFDGAEHTFRAVCKLTGQILPGCPFVCNCPRRDVADEETTHIPAQWLERLEALSFESIASRLRPRDAVAYLYLIILGRLPDEAGLASYVSRVQRSKLTWHGVAREMIGSQEFKEKMDKSLPAPHNVVRIYEESYIWHAL